MDNDITQLLELDNKSLLTMLGEYESKGGAIRDKVRKGVEILSNAKAKIKDLICKNEKIILLYKKYAQSKPVLIVSAIVDLIAPLFIKISPMLIAVLLFKEGLEYLCEYTWKKTST